MKIYGLGISAVEGRFMPFPGKEPSVPMEQDAEWFEEPL
jgi:hypothetical protein